MEKPAVLIVSIVPELSVRIASGLSKLGFKVSVLGKERFVGLRLLSCVKHYDVFDREYWNDLELAEDFAAYTENYCDKWGIDIILPLEVTATRLVRHAQQYLDTPTVALYDNDKRDFVNNKWNFFNFLQEHDLPSPDTHLLKDFDDIKLSSDDFPLIIKPLAEFGSNGIHRFDTYPALKTYLDTSGIQPPAIAQDFMPGVDYSVAVLARNGNLLAWAINKFNGDMSQREFVSNPEVLSLARNIIEHMEYDGIAVLDIRYDERDGSHKAIEINPRIGSSDYFYSKAGINFSALWIANSIGEEIEGVEFKPVTSGVVKLNLYERLLPIFSSPPIDVFDNLIYGLSKRNRFLKNLYSIFVSRVLKRKDVFAAH